MALRGAPQKDQAVNRNPKVNEQLVFDDVPYTGPRPDLPATRAESVYSKEEGRYTIQVPISDLTRDWWESVTTLPHCAKWRAGDWAFAVTTALVADAVFAGDVARANELRQREVLMWATADARRTNKIVYKAVEEKTSGENVTQLSDYRDL